MILVFLIITKTSLQIKKGLLNHSAVKIGCFKMKLLYWVQKHFPAYPPPQ
jgi:hypothetical protein